ncbi:hypothetical protein [Bradyrhizobium sp. LHD-71]|uniref:hypothetical protein n=1 Tax=Bradyrhizobium sp. LHD-71 TaxID=3072141 RepID=UPI00280D6175|nr:hypothetical protein [Bradyrhizobium sp. LHD-71]MDQ8727378.1 hypothetical protein [Bradyrhizobium sp. LHD-71]
MPADPQGKKRPEPDRLDVAADEAIAMCGGDMRSTIRALLLANEFLEHEVKELMVAVSKGYERRRRNYLRPPPSGRKDYD